MLKKKTKNIILVGFAVFFAVVNSILFILKTKIPLIFFQLLEAYILSKLLVEKIDEHIIP